MLHAPADTARPGGTLSRPREAGPSAMRRTFYKLRQEVWHLTTAKPVSRKQRVR
ncbi:hypothetical protein ACTVZO_38385 [Streptomyces sp. IBSNAI002]|uniref:hypothetical protein n=1 Tax=Streptomyces sp. IBSNAI002 TaxID=3457500 RepID=UPI003FCF8F4E